ncbi:NADH:flavin oxidoreductase/NADH oxidase [Ferruginibacter sp. HRS2-29]|uniref:NADH:flavin oxidoreductase/NADH oxidase n=1 Tax=Ferruginibacter sp. HRS2-29 TaxID=2487334 RepID=UPI0020CEA595|nr:NADH:flavin oxidoreductase/NADH oxidase [Ferruginibacter sp. HRS2-29]MCP9749371.1 NADH:flavin oxidoreductase/NADH oxidase [Ferruginibacter sp. HRS2-29]
MSALFQPLTIRNITFKNRLVVSPMCQYSSIDGFANDWHLVHLGSKAVGGAGLVITEATAVSPEGRISPGDLGIWKDEQVEFLQRITSFISSNGSIPGIQLAHAGRKASHHAPWEGNKALKEDEGAWHTLAPSAVPYADGEPVPREMTLADIRQCINDFSKAAQRAIDAGFKVFEIHAAHGYLLNQFLSPLSNKRTDEYGGSFENRTRLLLEVIEAVRKVIGYNLPLFVRISATEWVEGGWTMDDSLLLAGALKDASVDLIDCSSGGNSRDQKIAIGPLYQVDFAEAIKKTGLLTGAVGLITTASEAEVIIASGQADMVFMAREFLRDTYFPLHAAKELSIDVEWPKQYVRAKI